MLTYCVISQIYINKIARILIISRQNELELSPSKTDTILLRHTNRKTYPILVLTIIISDLLPMMMRPVALQPPHFARELIPESSFSSCLPTIHHPMYDHDSNEMYGGRGRMIMFRTKCCWYCACNRTSNIKVKTQVYRIPERNNPRFISNIFLRPISKYQVTTN